MPASDTVIRDLYARLKGLQVRECELDLPPLSRTNRMEVRSVNQENDGYEEESIYRATDRWLS